MTDGPFKNLQLPARLKAVVNTLDNDAYGNDERGFRICDAALKSISDTEGFDLVAELDAQACQQQMVLDSLNVVENIFDKYPSSSFADKFRKKLTYAVAHGASIENALEQSLLRVFRQELREFENRVRDELVRTRKVGEAHCDQAHNLMKNFRRAIAAAPVEEACAAIRRGDKNAFKVPKLKKIDAEDGPNL